MSEPTDCSPELGPFVEATTDKQRSKRWGRARRHQRAEPGTPERQMCDECAAGWSYKNARDYKARQAKKASS